SVKRSALRVERRIRCEEDPIDAEEVQAAPRGRVRTEQRGVGVKHFEVIDRPLLHRSEQASVIFIRSPLAQLVPAVPDSALEVWNHRSHVMGDDLYVWIPVKKSRKDKPRHRHAGLVRPSERPPDFILRFLLA